MYSEAELRKLVSELVEVYVSEEDSSSDNSSQSCEWGIFTDMEQAISAAVEAQKRLVALPLEIRRNIVAAIRETAEANAQEFANRAVLESGRGNIADKVKKNLLAARRTPGVEDIETVAYSDEHGLTVVERAPYGVIGSIIPVTNPTATIINNGLSMISGANTVVFNPHPGARQVSCFAIQVLNRAIEKAGGPANTLVSLAEPTIASASMIMKHRDISLLVVTGGPAVVQAAMGSGKKVIAAGPGNPPCVVDATAHISQAARHIVDGASFDNNMVCICEKEVLVVKDVADELIKEMQRCGAYLLQPAEAEKLVKSVIAESGNADREGAVRKEFVGMDASVLAKSIGLDVPESTRLLICEVGEDNPLVWTEQLMPLLPIVRLDNVDQCIDLAARCEHGFRHSAMMHSMDVGNMTNMARRMNSSLFVKNGPCYAGLGQGGAGYTSLTIASPTGEGLTRARTFTRERRCTLVDYLRIV